jgi:LCP family protein required for cell wall assembly
MPIEQGETFRLRGAKENQINILFLGVGGEGHIGGNYLTDTIILFVITPSTKKAAAISIPRDMIVRAPDKKTFTRINALFAIPKDSKKFPGPMGIAYTKEAVENITGFPVQYFAVLDLTGLGKIVDALGGIYVRRLEDLEDSKFPDKNYGYETYKIEEGWRYLAGPEAVKYIRTRHTLGGDFDRMRRQQEVAVAIAKKAAGLTSLTALPKILSLYGALKNNFATDLSLGELKELAGVGEAIRAGEVRLERIVGGPDGLLSSDTVVWGGKEAYVLKPKAGIENYEEIRLWARKIVESLK